MLFYNDIMVVKVKETYFMVIGNVMMHLTLYEILSLAFPGEKEHFPFSLSIPDSELDFKK